MVQNFGRFGKSGKKVIPRKELLFFNSPRNYRVFHTNGKRSLYLIKHRILIKGGVSYTELSLCLHRNQRTIQGFSLTFKDLLKMELNSWTASTALFTQNIITLWLVVVYMKKSRHPGYEVTPDAVANMPKFTVLAIKIQKSVAMLATRTLQFPFIVLLCTVLF